MQPRYSLRRTLYRDAPRGDQVRMSGAPAQKVRIAGLESAFVGGNDGTGGGVRVGQEVATILAPQAKASQRATSNEQPSTSTPCRIRLQNCENFAGRRGRGELV